MPTSRPRRAPRPPRNRLHRRRGSAGLGESWPLIGAGVLLLAGTVGVVSTLDRSDPCADPQRTVPAQYHRDIQQAAETSGLPPAVIAAQLDQESRWDPQAVSPVGAQGLAQFMPDTWEIYGEGSVTDPHASIRAQGEYLADLREMVSELEPADAQQEQDLVLAAYNAGPTRVLRDQGVPQIRETQQYVQRIDRLADTRYRDFCAAPAD